MSTDKTSFTERAALIVEAKDLEKALQLWTELRFAEVDEDVFQAARALILAKLGWVKDEIVAKALYRMSDFVTAREARLKAERQKRTTQTI